MRTKVQELSIFTVGIGILLGALTLWLLYALSPQPGQQRSFGLVEAVVLAICAILIVLGILTQKLKSPLIINVTLGVVTLGLILDLALSFNIVKAVISGLVIWLVLKTGREALEEVKAAKPVMKSSSEMPDAIQEK